ncbi:ABC transporter permease [Stomatohabitans albus]
MAIKELRELLRDRRTLALLVIIPIVLLIIFGYAANFSVDRTSILITGPGKTDVEAVLRQSATAQDDFSVHSAATSLTQDEISTALQHQDYAAIVVAQKPDHNALLSTYTHIYIDGSELFSAQSVQRAWMRVIADDNRTHVTEIRADIEDARRRAEAFKGDLSSIRTQIDTLRTTFDGPLTPEVLAQLQQQPSLPTIPETPELPDTTVLSIDDVDIDQLSTVYFNPDLKTSWIMVPGLIGVVITFIGVIVTSIGLVRERETGTLEQLAVMPIRPTGIILGKIAPYFALALADASAITAIGVSLFGVPFTGSIWRYAIFTVLFVVVVLGVGILISSLSETTGQAIQLSIMVVLPQALMSGLVFPLESMGEQVRWIGYVLPLTWFIKVSRGIMLRDASIEQLSMSLVILFGMAIVLFGAATIRMHMLLRKGGAVR